MSQGINISLDSLGRLLIPAAIQQRLKLAAGMTLVVDEEDENGVWLRLQTESPKLIDKEGVLVVKAESSSSLADIVQQERDSRVLNLMQRIGL